MHEDGRGALQFDHTLGIDGGLPRNDTISCLRKKMMMLNGMAHDQSAVNSLLYRKVKLNNIFFLIIKPQRVTLQTMVVHVIYSANNNYYNITTVFRIYICITLSNKCRRNKRGF